MTASIIENGEVVASFTTPKFNTDSLYEKLVPSELREEVRELWQQGKTCVCIKCKKITAQSSRFHHSVTSHTLCGTCRPTVSDAEYVGMLELLANDIKLANDGLVESVGRVVMEIDCSNEVRKDFLKILAALPRAI